MQVQDRVAIITGASAGIGLATARLLSERGARLALVARSKYRLEKLAAELPDAIAVPADMTRPYEVRMMVERSRTRLGSIDILVNNAGQGYDSPVENINPDTWRYILELDLMGPVIAMQQVIPIMRNKGGGAIVNISSGLTLMHLPNSSPYSSVKSALADISLTARIELEKDNISVSVVYPYVTLTDFEKNTIRDTPTDEPEQGGGGRFPPDTAEFVALKILEAIEGEEAEVLAHDWMKNVGL